MLDYRLYPPAFIQAVSAVQGPKVAPIHRVKAPLGWPETATSVLANDHEEAAGMEQRTVSAKTW